MLFVHLDMIKDNKKKKIGIILILFLPVFVSLLETKGKKAVILIHVLFNSTVTKCTQDQ